MENIEIMQTGAAERIAQEINFIKRQAARQLLAASCEIGERLIQAKGVVPHGEWGEWLKTNVDYSESTAQNLMRIYREYGDGQIGLDGKSPSEIFGKLSYSQAVALFALAPADREEFIEDNNLDEMSTRELKEAIAARKAAEEKAERLSEENAEAERRIEQLEGEVESAAAAGREESEREIKRLKSELETSISDRTAVHSALDKAREQLDKAKKKQDELRAKVKELTDAPAEISPEQLAKIEEEIAERFRSETDQLKLTAESEKAARERMETELEAAKKKLQMSADGDLHKFQALFERFQLDLEKLAGLARSIGGETGDKLLDLLKSLIEQV